MLYVAAFAEAANNNADDTDEKSIKHDSKILLIIACSFKYLASNHARYPTFVIYKSRFYFWEVICKITHFIRNLIK